MDILDFDDHLSLLVKEETGMFILLQAWEDEPGGVRVLGLSGFLGEDSSPAMRAWIAESAIANEAIDYLGGTAELVFDSWRGDTTLVLKHIQP